MTDNAPDLLAGPNFESLFSSFASTAFRLETRESYYEMNELKAFLSGGPNAVPANFLQDWLRLMRANIAAGRQIRRVRIVSEPHSDYTRFGLWLSGHNVNAGEDIRYLPRAQADELGLPKIDYWIFDSGRLFIVHFADDNSLLGAEANTDAAAIAQALAWQETAWKHSIPRDVYSSRYG
jgi:hypothetical protein